MNIIRRLFVVLCITLTTPVMSQVPVVAEVQSLPVVEGQAPNDAQRIAELERQNAELRYEKDIAEIRAELTASQSSSFQLWTTILIGFFTLFITIAILYITLRTEKAAVSAAAIEARLGIESEREQVEGLLIRAEGDLERFEPLLEQARSSVANIAKEEARAKELGDRLKAAEPPEDEKTREEVREVAETSSKKRKKDRTPSDFKILITRARITEDWAEVLKQAEAMEAWLDDDAADDDLAFALFGQAFAWGKLDESEKEVARYDRLISRFGDSDTPALQEQVANALFNKGVALGALDRHEAGLAVYDDVVARFSGSDAPALQEQVADALFNKACAYAVMQDVASTIKALDQWRDRLGHFDCDGIANDTDFDTIRDHPDFRQFLQDNDCDCGPAPPDAPPEPGPDHPNPAPSKEAAGPDLD